MADYFVEGVRFRDVQPGDVIAELIGNEALTVIACSPACDEEWARTHGPLNTPEVEIHVTGRDSPLRGHPNQIIGVIHRRYPEGQSKRRVEEEILETNQDMLMASAREREKLVPKLRKLLGVYELGK